MFKEMFGIQKAIKKILSGLRYIAPPIVILCVFFLIRNRCHPYIVSGDSMNPTLTNADIITTEPVADNTRIRRGDIVIAQTRSGLFKKSIIKRVIALPGETITLTNESIFINGEEFEDFVDSPPINAGEESQTYTLGEDEYFLLGDNRPVSIDSRYHGPFKKEQIVAIYNSTLIDR